MAGPKQKITDFASLKDIPLGSIVLVAGIKVVANARPGEKRWERDEGNLHEVSGYAFNGVESKPEDIVAHIAADDTMMTRIYQDDYLLIDTAEIAVPSDGGVFAVVWDNQPVKLRRLYPRPGNGLTIVCDNIQYPSMSIVSNERESISLVGRVKALLRSGGF
jgi:phage repressor protein C with HTH and peptisase S24 domain